MAAPCASSDTARGARLVTLRVPAEAERRRSRIARRRAAVLIGVHVLAAAHAAHWLVAGQTLAPLELNEVLHTLHLGVVTAGFLFMALAVLATALFGRFFCSWGCHLLALQDLSAWALEKLGVRPRPLRSRALLYVPLGAMLYLFVWPQVERIAAGRALPALHVATDADGWASFVTRDLWRNLPGPAIALVTLAVCGLVIVYVLGSRSFCRYACPYGAVFGLADRVAPGRIVQSGDCDACGLCTAVCQSHVRVHEEIRAGGAVVDPRCLKDLDCVAICPRRALRYGAARPPLFASRPPPPPPRHDLSLGEDAVLVAVVLASLLVLRGLYGAVPFLLALGASVVVGASVVLAARMRRRPRVRVGHVDLVRRSRATPAGLAFVAALGVALVFLGHSAVVRWHEVRGGAAWDEIAAALERGDAPSSAALEQAAAHLEGARDAGLLVPLDLRRRIASLAELRGRPELAARELSAVIAEDPEDAEARGRLARIHLARGVQLARRGEHARAARQLERAAELDPEDATARTSLGAAFAELGRLDEAIDATREAVRLAPRDAAAHANLGLLLAARRDPNGARAHLRRALTLDPDDARARAALAALSPTQEAP